MVNTSDKFNSLEQLDTRMDYCLDSWYDYSTKRRIEIVEIYLEWFWKFTERIPQPTRLKELSDFILMEELADTHPDKVTRKEYPILTGKQVERRNKKTVLTAFFNDFVHYELLLLAFFRGICHNWSILLIIERGNQP